MAVDMRTRLEQVINTASENSKLVSKNPRDSTLTIIIILYMSSLVLYHKSSPPVQCKAPYNTSINSYAG